MGDLLYRYDALSNQSTFTLENGSIDRSLSGNCTLRVLIKDFNSYVPKFIFPSPENSTFRVKSVT
jgi:hypothetical protein